MPPSLLRGRQLLEAHHVGLCLSEPGQQPHLPIRPPSCWRAITTCRCSWAARTPSSSSDGFRDRRAPSNIEAAELLHRAGSTVFSWACLAHLFHDNNSPDVALATHTKVLGKR